MSTSYQMRECANSTCDLRYPLSRDHTFGERCPICLGQTRLISQHHYLPENPKHPVQQPTRAKPNLHVFLDNIRSGWNVGSVFRSADGFGFSHIYLGGISASPEHKEVQKTALGAQNTVSWSVHRNGYKHIQSLQAAGWSILALEVTDTSLPINRYNGWKHINNLVLVLGNENTGIDPGILSLSDQVTHFNMHGQKKSLNVASAFSAAAAIIFDRFS